MRIHQVLLTYTSDVVFFFAYIQPAPKEGAIWSNAEELCEVNGKGVLSIS